MYEFLKNKDVWCTKVEMISLPLCARKHYDNPKLYESIFSPQVPSGFLGQQQGGTIFLI